MQKKYNHGFTIVELIVVIVVIGILASIGFVSYVGLGAKARDTSVLSDIDIMDTLQTSYGTKNNVAGKVYYSGNGPDAALDFTPSSGNVIDVVINNTDYCIRGYNPGGTKKTINDSFSKGSSSDACNDTSLAPSPDATHIIASVNIVGSMDVNEVLSITKNPVNATLAYRWQRSDDVGGPYSDITGATGSTYKLVSGDLNKYIRIIVDGTGDYSGSATSQPTTAIAFQKWIDGVGSMPPTKQVYYQDLPGLFLPGPDTTSCGSLCEYKETWPWSMPTLKSPQLNPTLNFSSYPAQVACINIGGRLPSLDELRSIYVSRATYNAFAGVSWYLPSNQDDYYTYYSILGGSNSYTYDYNRSTARPVRCVRG